jgi:hypothetical protein
MIFSNNRIIASDPFDEKNNLGAKNSNSNNEKTVHK